MAASTKMHPILAPDVTAMEHYQLADIKTIEANLFSDIQLEENVVHMKVQSHSRMQNLLGFALNKIKGDEVTQIIWYGEGLATQKAISCADVMKRKNKNLYMLSRKGIKRVEEYWDPIFLTALDRLKVNKDTDAVSILLSKLPLDALKHEKGYVGLDTGPEKAKPSSQTKDTSKEKGEKKPVRNKPRHRPNKGGNRNVEQTGKASNSPANKQ